MSLLEWAEREIELACERENPNRKPGEWDYGCACYESAFKAFKSLMEDGHSGFSIGLTKNILVRLIEGRPLTPITEDEDSWGNEYKYKKSGVKSYQCGRMSSLFKDVYPDGRVEYHDVDRFTCISINGHGSYHSGLVTRIMHEEFPIGMPYSGEKWKVYCEDFLTDPKNGDFDTVGIHYAINPNGEKIEIRRYFKDALTKTGWDEIDSHEFLYRRSIAEEREVKNEQSRDETSC